ncbi:MAG: hypothetical protein EP300_00575 [Gammaproteobacteria bacterium]|nr:MAG: hypothetical protein EP300_00575 [Gammaproteobacteria bacterium]
MTETLASDAVSASEELTDEVASAAALPAVFAFFETTANASLSSRSTTSLALSISAVTEEVVILTVLFILFKPEALALDLVFLVAIF